MTGRAKTGLTAVALFVLAAAAPPRTVAGDQAPSDVAFGRLKSLVGTWEGIDTGSGRPTVATYTLTGGGKVLLEVMGGMATAYHLDKGTLALTHFCGAGNQPRMRAKTIGNEGRHIAFEMYDITNHPNPDSYYTSAIDVRFLVDGTIELVFRGMTVGRESTQTLHLLKRRGSTGTR